MAKPAVQIIGLNQLELSNDDIFVRKTVDDMDPNAMVVVYETHNAILLKNGRLQETLQAGDYPLFDVKHGLFKDSKVGSLTVDLIYVSKTAEMQVHWGTPTQFTFRDPVTELSVRVGASGEFGVKVEDPRKLYCELIGTKKEFSVQDLRERLKGRLLNEIEPAIAKVMRSERLSYAAFTEHKQEVASGIRPLIAKMFSDSYGLAVTYFIIGNVVIHSEDKQALEQELSRVKALREQEAQEQKQKDDYRWWVAEYERLEDRQFERERLMRELQSADYDKYLDVCKIVGWQNGRGGAGKFCTHCGAAYADGAKFCGQCGKPVGTTERKCAACGHVNGANNKFCAQCGKALQ